MSSHRSQRSAERVRTAVRVSVGSRGLGVLLAMAVLLAGAWPVWAAEIVEVRIGRHPTYTRIVFELDRPAGYRIQRSDPAEGLAELIVSVEAGSIPRSVSSEKSFIDRVDIEPQGSRSIARLKLTQTGLRLTEMILASPPRIVLDLARQEPAAAPISLRKPAAEPAIAPVEEDADQEDPAFDEIMAGIEPADAAEQAEPLAETAPVAEPTPSAGEAVGEASIAEGVAPEADDERIGRASELADPPALAKAKAGAIAPASALLADEPSTSTPIERTPPVARTPTVAKPPAVEPAPKPRAPMVARSTTPEGQDDGWRSWALAGAAAMILLGGGLFVSRRRAAAQDFDEQAGADTEGAEAGGFTADRNPFLSGDGSESQLEPSEAALEVGSAAEDGPDSTAVPNDETESESLFGEFEEKDMDEMEMISQDQTDQGFGASAMPPSMPGGADEMQQMFVEMTRRLEALEARCDALADARDRLERQVAAQTEELRVQRAAIARTQRAVRNLGRGDAEADEPTEPAPRDPSR